EEWELLENHYNRVTDTCIPEAEAFRRLQQHIHKLWKDADDKNERYFPHEYMYKMLLSGVLEQYYEIDPANSWMLAAAQKNIPIVVPGWEYFFGQRQASSYSPDQFHNIVPAHRSTTSYTCTHVENIFHFYRLHPSIVYEYAVAIS